MRRLALLLGMLAMMPMSLFAATLFKMGQAEIITEDYQLAAWNNVKYVNYIPGELLTVTLSYAYVSDAPISLIGISQRMPMPFTPNGTKGVIAVVEQTADSITFQVAFTQFKGKGKKLKGVSHLDLIFDLGADYDGDGANDILKVGVQVSASTASTP
jgi:hypothetical protein